jgi:hypothetical protein
MNIKKILIIASVALASIAAGYGLFGLRPAGGAGGGTGPDPLLGVGDGAPRVAYLDVTASYRDDDGWDDDRYEDEEREDEERGSERHEHEDDDHDDD